MAYLTAEEIQAVTLSLKVATAATAVSLPFALAIAYVLARKFFPGKQIVNGLVHLPLVLPPVVTGYILLLSFGLRSTLRRLEGIGPVVRRQGGRRSPDGGVICDYMGEVDDPDALAAAFDAVPGLVEHGLFPPSLVTDVVVAHGTHVEWRRVGLPCEGLLDAWGPWTTP